MNKKSNWTFLVFEIFSSCGGGGGWKLFKSQEKCINFLLRSFLLDNRLYTNIRGWKFFNKWNWTTCNLYVTLFYSIIQDWQGYREKLMARQKPLANISCPGTSVYKIFLGLKNKKHKLVKSITRRNFAETNM